MLKLAGQTQNPSGIKKAMLNYKIVYQKGSSNSNASIPNEYTELDHIVAAGDFGFTTDYKLSSDDYIDCKVTTDESYGPCAICGCYTDSSANDNFCIYSDINSYAINAVVGTETATSGELEQNKRYSMYLSNEHFSVSYGSQGVYDKYFSEPTVTCSAYFTVGKQGNMQNNFKGLIERVSIVNKDAGYVVDLVPVRRNSDYMLGMYDIINGVFYPNEVGTEVI